MSRREFRHVANCLLRTESQLLQPTDSDLLARFANNRDEQAFAELVARHGGLVRGTARRCLRNCHAADEVFQATFMTLARKAGEGRWTAAIGAWLHATAVNLSRRALSRMRPVHADLTDDVLSSDVDPATAVAWGEVCQILDEELVNLAEKLRSPLVLCYLQGYTRDEAAQAIGCSLASLKRYLERGRRLLSERLKRRGVTLPAVGVGVLASDLTVDASAIDATTRTAVEFVSQGVASPQAAALLKASNSGLNLKTAALIAAMLGAIACGVTFATLAEPVNEHSDTHHQSSAAASKTDGTASSDDLSEVLPAGAIARLGSPRLRNGGKIVEMVFSPDGTKLATWTVSHFSINNLFTIWDAKTGRALSRVNMPVGQLAWLANGRGIALVHSEVGPFLWEFTDEKAEKPELIPREERAIPVVGRPINPGPPVVDNECNSCFAISPDGTKLAIGRAGQLEKDREVQFWELKTGVRVDELKPLKGGVINPANCASIHFTPNAKTLVVFSQPKLQAVSAPAGNGAARSQGITYEDGNLVTVWDVATSREKVRFKAPRPGYVYRLLVALTDTTLAIGLEDGTTSLWDLGTGKEHKLATGDTDKVGGTSIAFSPDGKTLAIGGRDGATRLWEVGTCKLLRTINRHQTQVRTLAFESSGKMLATADQDGIIRLWNAATGVDSRPVLGPRAAVGAVALSPDGKLAITAGRDETLRWWDATAGTERRLVTVGAEIKGLALSPDGKTVLVSTKDGKLRTWDAATGNETTPATLPRDIKFQKFTFTRDGNYLVAASGPKATIWAWPALKLVRAIDLPKPAPLDGQDPPTEGEIVCQDVAVSPNGKWLITVALQNWTEERNGKRHPYNSTDAIDVWDFATGKRLRRLVEPGLWFDVMDPATGKAFRQVSFSVRWALKEFWSGSFTEDGLFVMIGTQGTIPAHDGREAQEIPEEISLLDPVAGRVVRSFPMPLLHDWLNGHGLTTTWALSPDGRTLYGSYSAGDIIANDLVTGKPLRRLTGHLDTVSGLSLSADGRRLLSGSNDGLAIVWDTAQMRLPAK